MYIACTYVCISFVFVLLNWFSNLILLSPSYNCATYSQVENTVLLLLLFSFFFFFLCMTSIRLNDDILEPVGGIDNNNLSNILQHFDVHNDDQEMFITSDRKSVV